MPRVGQRRHSNMLTSDGLVKVEWMTKKERELSPRPFSELLVKWVRSKFGCDVVAALWVRPDSHYWSMPGVECWDEARDATKYLGPHPVVCHPPCGPWGKFKWNCYKQPKEHGPLAIEFAHKWGGVVEQPLGSTLFKEHGRPGAAIVRLNQSDFRHRGLKPTLLYFAHGI